MLDVPPLSPRRQPRTLLYDNFRVGVNQKGDPTEIKQLRDCQNAIMDRFGFRKREGYAKKGTSLGSVKVTGLGDANVKGDLYHFAICGQVLKKWKVSTDSDWSNTDKVALTTQQNTTIKSFPFQDGSSSDNGTADADSTTRYIKDSAKSWTVDAYIGYIVHIDGGTGSGQRKLITANDADTLYVNEPFDITPDDTSTYDIYAVDYQACFANNSQNPWYYNGTSSSDITMPGPVTAFRDIETHDKRLWGLFRDQIWFSDEGFGNQFSNNSVIPFANKDRWCLRIEKLNEQLVVYKENSFGIVTGKNGIYGVQERSHNVGLYAVNSLATGAELQFFLSKCGVEIVNRYEYEITKEALPISENIAPWLAEHSAAELQAAAGWVQDNYYYLAISQSTNYYVYRYDILRSDPFSTNPDKQIWDRFKVADPINVLGSLNGDFSAGSGVVSSNGYVYTLLSGNDDDGDAIETVVQTRDEDFKYPDADKEFDKVHIWCEEATAAIQYTVEYRLDLASSWSTLGTFYANTDVEKEPAKGTLTLTGLPTATETFVVNATTFTAVASGATTDQFNIGTTADETADNIVDCLNSGSEAANISAYKGGEGIVIVEWTLSGTDGGGVTFTEALTNATADGSGSLTATAKGRIHKEFDLYKRGRTLGLKITRNDTLAADDGEIIKLGVHYQLDQRE